jgi:DNA-binding protein Fis
MTLTNGNKTRAAKLLGFGNPTTLTNWLKRHGGRAVMARYLHS